MLLLCTVIAGVSLFSDIGDIGADHNCAELLENVKTAGFSFGVGELHVDRPKGWVRRSGITLLRVHRMIPTKSLVRAFQGDLEVHAHQPTSLREGKYLSAADNEMSEPFIY